MQGMKNQKGLPREATPKAGEAGVIHIFAGLVVLLLIAGIAVGVYLIQKQQIFKSRASSAPIIDALEIKDNEGKVINCDSNVNPPVCTISSPDVTIRLANPGVLVPAAARE